ncbi:putative Thioredoxin [Trypanosoma vivax]|nr:putative Thioredoxin [Trypanosoma vivax]
MKRYVVALLLAAQLFLTHVVVPCCAFPFPKSSGVVELTPSTLPGFLSTHKPVFILFYAPWCGHCRRIHPEWEKFAKAVEGVVRVGAINVDEHQQVGQQFSIRGFPTVKFWGLGEKVMNKAEDYNGQRDAGSIQARAISVITSSSVKELSTSKELRDAAESAPGKKIVVLFSAKSRVPPIYAVLSHSPRLKVMPFYFVGKQMDSDLAKEFGVEKLPGIVVLNATGADMKMVKYPGKKIAYNPIAKYLLACAVDTFDEATFSEEGGEAEEGPETVHRVPRRTPRSLYLPKPLPLPRRRLRTSAHQRRGR